MSGTAAEQLLKQRPTTPATVTDLTESRRRVALSLRRELRRLARLTRLLAHTLLGASIALTALGSLVRRRRHDAVVRWWVRGVLRILDVRVEVVGVPGAGSTLYAANHISWLDIPCLRATLDVEFVAKQEVARWPVIGRMAERAGTLFLNRGERDASLTAANSMSDALTAGRSVAIFPEGTTGDGRRLGRFHARLYQAAIRTHRPVQAVAIAYPHPGDVHDSRDGGGRAAPGAAAEGRTSVAGVPSGEANTAHRMSKATVHPAAPFVGDDNLGRHVWALLAEESLTARLTFCPPIHALGERRTLAERTRAQIATALDSRSAAPVHRNVIAV